MRYKIAGTWSLNGRALRKYFHDNNILLKIYDFGSEQIFIKKAGTFKKSFPSTYKYLLANKITLSTRDKANKTYPSWYAYGRTQSLQSIKNKLFLPKITNSF